jgi:hypothetical protein
MDLQKLIARMDQIEAKGIVEAGDPAEYARAQQQMANLEKAAKYTGDDEIVRGRMGLPPKLPPIEQWDGKMPTPTGKPDWVARLTTMGRATDAQANAVKQNDASNTSAGFIKDMIPKIAALLDKAEKETATPVPAAGSGSPMAGVKETMSFSSGIAKALAEGLGFTLKEGAMEELAPLMAQVADIEDPALKPLQDRYAALLNKPAAGAAGGATTPGATPGATPATGGNKPAVSTQGAEASAKFKAEKLARLKEITAKLQASASKAPGKGATAAALAAGGANPLAADPISANAKPKAESQLSEAEKYASLRDRLLMIETRVDEGPLDFAKGIYQAAKTGFSGAPVATGKLTKAGAQQMAGQGSKQFAKQLAKAPATQRAAYNTAKVVKANPVKTALGATAVGAGTAYALSGDAKKPEVVPPKVPGQTGTPVPGKTPTPTPTTGATDVDDIKALTTEIDAIEKELMGSDGSAFQDDPEIQKAIADAKAAAGGAAANQKFSG